MTEKRLKHPSKKMNLGIKIFLIITVVMVLCTVCTAFVWSQYEAPQIMGAEVPADASNNTIESITRKWFEEWSDGHEGWKVPPSYRLKNTEIINLDSLADGYIEVHYRARISWWSQKAVQNLELISTDSRNVYEGQWVLKWQEEDGLWKMTEVLSPVQYQIQSPEFQEEINKPQTAHFSYDSSKKEAPFVKDGVLYVTYDGGMNFIEVPDGYEQVLKTPNGTYNEYLPDGSCLVTSSLTAFAGFSGSKTKLIYSTDEGKSWQESIIYEGGYYANTFLSKTDNFCYVTFAVDRTGGSDYYGTFRSSDLAGWESVSLPDPLFSNVSCVCWTDDNTGYYAGSSDSYYMTKDAGKSYEMYSLPHDNDIIASLGYNPYDCMESIYQEEGITYMIVGQGDDGDYARNGSLLKALFKSEDGIHFSFVNEIEDKTSEAG